MIWKGFASMDTIIHLIFSIFRGVGVEGDMGGLAPHEYPFTPRGFPA
jgi:hypothetical protein